MITRILVPTDFNAPADALGSVAERVVQTAAFLVLTARLPPAPGADAAAGEETRRAYMAVARRKDFAGLGNNSRSAAF